MYSMRARSTIAPPGTFNRSEIDRHANHDATRGLETQSQ
jgi:hypothetical protein